MTPPRRVWRVRGGVVPLDRPAVLGILNLTPDSFSDGGRWSTLDAALAQAHAMVEAGAAVIDVGGESTRPGARPVPAEEELRRVLPFVEAAAPELGVPISIDTRSATVARACLDAGAAIVNDVSALAHDPEMAEVVAEAGAGVILMHMRGTPDTMNAQARYADVAEDVARELRPALERAAEAGIPEDAVVTDPGIGFAKETDHSLTLLRRLGPLLALGRPVLVGPSRKRFLGEVLGVDTEERLHGTVSACVMAYLAGADLFRVHDVGPVVQALNVAAASAAAAGAGRTA